MSENGRNSKAIELPQTITVRDLARELQSSPIEIIKNLMANGVMANINQQIDFDTAAVVVSEMGFEATLETPEAAEEDTSKLLAYMASLPEDAPALEEQEDVG